MSRPIVFTFFLVMFVGVAAIAVQRRRSGQGWFIEAFICAAMAVALAHLSW